MSGSAAGSSKMVATSHPLAVSTAHQIWKRGGNAVDAAVAASAMLTVVDPRSTGIGGDLFALVWPAGEDGPAGLSAAGPAPTGLSMESLRAAGFEEMPSSGPWAITVPGSVSGWEEIVGRYGRLTLAEILEPAISAAIEGVPVAPYVAEEWATCFAKLASNEEAARLFLPGGGTPAEGEVFANPDLGEALRRIATEGSGYFYRGEAADAIERAVAALGGPLRADDLAEWSGPEWSDAISIRYRDVDVFEIPPPGQGMIALQALGIYASVDPPEADADHYAIEAMKLAFADAQHYITDPNVHPVPIEELLSEEYLRARAGELDPRRAQECRPGSVGDTVYVATADESIACSLIQSVYEGFGSGVAVPGLGIALQNRGAGFVMDDAHPNRPEPGKRPYHTIIPAMLGDESGFLGCLGVVGGFMQPQGQFQIIRNLFDKGMSPQHAMDAPRFRYTAGRRVSFEPSYDAAVVAELGRRGHEISELSRFEAGGGQLVLRTDDGFVGASDPRKDGTARGS